MEFLLVKFVAALALPPTPMFLLLGLGLIMIWRKARYGLAVATLGFVTLLLLSTPFVARMLVLGLERYPPVEPESLKNTEAGAIVILGGGRSSVSPEYGGEDTVSQSALERIRFGARVQRATGLPVLVSGGRLYKERHSEAELMRDSLVEDFNVPVKWVEQKSLNSAENAIYTHEMLSADGVKHIILVTHTHHMARSAEIFKRQGFEVTPASTKFSRRRDDVNKSLSHYLPGVHALQASRESLHEYLGMLWYALRY